jgi:hypothetical protein
VYAILRYNSDEAVMVLVNLTGKPVSGYSLSLTESILPDNKLNPASLLDPVNAAPLTIRGGQFSEYKPIAEVSPYQAYLFQIK